jgi:diacylglycerol kinase family enzyme
VKTRQGKKFSFFELATIGLSAAIYPVANKIASGNLSGAQVTALTLTHQETRPKVFLTLDDENEIEIEAMLVMVSNTPAFGKNLQVAVQDGLLDISVYPDLGKADLLSYFGQVTDGSYSGDGKVQHYQAHKLKVKASPKLDVMADGIALGKGSVTIRVRPDALRVITPEIKSHPSDTQNAAEMLPTPVSPAAGKNHRENSAMLVG